MTVVESIQLWRVGKLLAAALVLASCSSPVQVHAESTGQCGADTTPPVELQWSLVEQYPHDSNAYTQGLYVADGYLFEGTGRYGESSLRKVVLDSGKIRRMVSLPEDYFGEGVALLDGRIYQLTWREQTGFVYDADTFEQIASFSYETEGWGLTEDGSRLIMSDGTANLYFLEPQSLERTGQLQVCDNEGPVTLLNELEYVDGFIYANIYGSNRIVLISPEDGRVVASLDMSSLAREHKPRAPDAVLNGIAYDKVAERLFVTGKLWSFLFEIAIDTKILAR